jgi:hypothetical protein
MRVGEGERCAFEVPRWGGYSWRGVLSAWAVADNCGCTVPAVDDLDGGNLGRSFALPPSTSSLLTKSVTITFIVLADCCSLTA